MKTLWFVVPAHRRYELTRVCLRQLARTCEDLRRLEIDASAVVISSDKDNLEVAAEIGFATVRRDNAALGRRFNDGFQLACDPDYNPRPVDYVVPCGSDDWIDSEILRDLPPPDRIGVFRQLATVNEDRTRLSRLRVGYKGGVGIRVIPRQFLERAGYRPAEEDRKRAIDTSTLEGLKRAMSGRMPQMVELDLHSLQIVDWKSRETQLNSYDVLRLYRRSETCDPFVELGAYYPAEALEEMAAL